MSGRVGVQAGVYESQQDHGGASSILCKGRRVLREGSEGEMEGRREGGREGGKEGGKQEGTREL